MITLKIDNRETKIKDLLILENVSILFENLQYGDYVFEIYNKPIIFIERKTINDLASSIKDNRFFNQKNALLTNIERKMIYYIIEGDINYQESSVIYSGISMSSIQSCIINTMIRDDIKIIITKNINDTISLIKAISLRLVKNPNKYICNENELIKEPVITKFKANMLGKDKFFENIMLQIPKISYKSAKAIVNKFENFENFYSTMKEKNKDEQNKILSSITTQDNNGNNRKISSAIVNNIIDYFF